jgi:hypothetical protein
MRPRSASRQGDEARRIAVNVARLGATHDCAVCGTTIVEPFAFAEAVLRHYGAADEGRDLHQRIETAVLRSSTETGGWGDGSLCAYHNEQASKHD